MNSIDQLQKAEKDARAQLILAQNILDKAYKEREDAERAKRIKEQNAKYAREAEEAVENSSLPKWLVEWIQYKAYEDGHSSGQSEVDMHTFSMIHDAEHWKREHEKKHKELPVTAEEMVNKDKVDDLIADKDDGACPDDECSGGIVEGICSHCEDEWAWKKAEQGT